QLADRGHVGVSGEEQRQQSGTRVARGQYVDEPRDRGRLRARRAAPPTHDSWTSPARLATAIGGGAAPARRGRRQAALVRAGHGSGNSCPLLTRTRALATAARSARPIAHHIGTAPSRG